MDWTRKFVRVIALIVWLTSLSPVGWAASATISPPQAPISTTLQKSSATAFIDKVRFSQDAEQFRIVLDMTAIPAYTMSLTDTPQQLEIELPNTYNRSGTGQLAFNDPFVESIRFTDLGGGRLKAIISLKIPVQPKISTMGSPNRIVIDLQKYYESKNESTIAPGVVYREIFKGRAEGSIKAYIVEVDPKFGYTLKPVLSNDSVAGIEVLSDMAERTKGIAMINGPYFMRSGEILGLMKIDRTIVSTPDIPRTAVGIMPNGKIIFDAPAFTGYVELPDKTQIPIEGINRSRGDSELILYNSYYAFWTLTSNNGMEYVVRGDKVIEIKEYNSVIPDGAVVLSASGRTAWQMSGLKVGDRVKIVQTLGPIWDKVVNAVGAGPSLVKNSEIYLTTQGEEFGSDVASGRAPRTALGVTREGKILLVVVDGRRRSSVGFTLWELAQFMLDQGAVDAMNMDGGGSSQMIVGDQTVNEPSDGRERKMGAGIAIVKTKPIK
jgi:exopolysaccharide biosynthesis protein